MPVLRAHGLGGGASVLVLGEGGLRVGRACRGPGVNLKGQQKRQEAICCALQSFRLRGVLPA